MKRIFIVSILLGFLVLPRPAKAGYAFVDCSGGTEGAFTSINDALNSLTPDDPYWNWIEVKGTCNESVEIWHNNKVGIFATWGETATIASPNPGTWAMLIHDSQPVYLNGLILTGGSDGLHIDVSSVVYMESCIAEYNNSTGVTVDRLSYLELLSTEFRNNGWAGLYLMNNSVAEALSWGENPGVRIRNNGGPGVHIATALLHTIGGITVENNGGFGVEIRTGTAVFGGVALGGNVIRGNQGGVAVQENGEVSFWGQNLVQNNGPFGIRASMGAYAEFFGWLSDWYTLVEGHSDVGLDLAGRAQAYSSGPNVFRNNGSGHPSAGIRVDGTSQLTMEYGNQVTNNVGSGIFADLNSSINLSDITISGNTGPGVLALHQSIAELGNGTLAGGNGGGALVCDQRSLVISNLFAPGQGCQSIEPVVGRSKPHYSLSRPQVSKQAVYKSLYDRLKKQMKH